MKRSIGSNLVLACCALALLISCSPDLQPDVSSAVQGAVTDPDAAQPQNLAPLCPDISFYGHIVEIFPHHVVVSTTPSFEWHYYFPGGVLGMAIVNWDQVCTPDRYTLYLSSGPDFTDTLVYQVFDPEISTQGNYFAGDLISNYRMARWDLNGSLMPMTTYRWTVVGYDGDLIIDDTMLQHLHDDEWWSASPEMGRIGGIFRTGPECTLESEGGLASEGGVEIFSLEDNAVINTLSPTFSWQSTVCAPLQYQLRVSTRQDFNAPLYYADVDLNPDYLPEEYTLIKYTGADSITLGEFLRDCTEYYWKIDSTIEDENGHIIPYWTTLPRSFTVRIGSCDPETASEKPTESAAIEQIVTAQPPPQPSITPSFSCWGLSDVDCKIHEDMCTWEPTSKTGGFCKPK